MKIHVVLTNSARAKVDEKSTESLKRYVQRLKLKNVNLDRVRRYGIISGEIDDPGQVQWLERKRDVEAVEIDTVKEAL